MAGSMAIGPLEKQNIIAVGVVAMEVSDPVRFRSQENKGQETRSILQRPMCPVTCFYLLAVDVLTKDSSIH